MKSDKLYAFTGTRSDGFRVIKYVAATSEDKAREIAKETLGNVRRVKA